MEEKTLLYNLVSQTYAINVKVEIDKMCNGFTVVNIGATAMTANGIPLAAPVAPALLGEAVQFGGNRNEIYIGRLDIAFTGGVGRCIITQKTYEHNAAITVKL